MGGDTFEIQRKKKPSGWCVKAIRRKDDRNEELRRRRKDETGKQVNGFSP